MDTYKNIINKVKPHVKKVAKESFSSLHNKNITQKKDGSFVTDFDIAIDHALQRELSNLFPEIPFISEESQPDIQAIEGLAWCIDPIDGTHNFMLDIPYYAVSVGLLHDGKPVAGIIYEPTSGNLLVGGENIPLSINNQSLNINNQSMIITSGRSHEKDMKILEREYIEKILTQDQLKYRRFGSCALDLMNLVLGRIGGVYILGNSIWDWAAGYAIAQAAGYVIEHKEETIVIYSKHLKEHIL